MDEREPKSLPSGFDAIVGNPPFQSQLSSRTAHDRGLAAIIAQNSEGRTGAYTDSAAIFLDQSLGLVQDGGTVALLLPQSVLASRDAERIRKAAAESAALEHLWLSDGNAFEDALVSTCAPVLRVSGRAQSVTRSHQAEITPLPDYCLQNKELLARETWAFLGSAARGVPTFDFAHSGSIQDIAHATADFRDEYYGLQGAIVESTPDLPTDNCPKLLTSGLLDPAQSLWGTRPTRIHKQSWKAPRVNTTALEANAHMLTWLQKRLVPKVMVATQTRILEVFVDSAGDFVPCMPVLTVVPTEPDRLWHVASLIGSPVATALAMDRYAGTARTGDAIKLAAKQVLELPAPQGQSEWDEAATAFECAQSAESDSVRREALSLSGKQICRAFRLTDADTERVMAWWSDRLIKRR